MTRLSGYALLLVVSLLKLNLNYRRVSFWSLWCSHRCGMLPLDLSNILLRAMRHLSILCVLTIRKTFRYHLICASIESEWWDIYGLLVAVHFNGRFLRFCGRRKSVKLIGEHPMQVYLPPPKKCGQPLQEKK